jgi:hypothetical protein
LQFAPVMEIKTRQASRNLDRGGCNLIIIDDPDKSQPQDPKVLGLDPPSATLFARR